MFFFNTNRYKMVKTLKYKLPQAFEFYHNTFLHRSIKHIWAKKTKSKNENKITRSKKALIKKQVFVFVATQLNEWINVTPRDCCVNHFICTFDISIYTVRSSASISLALCFFGSIWQSHLECGWARIRRLVFLWFFYENSKIFFYFD